MNQTYKELRPKQEAYETKYKNARDGTAVYKLYKDNVLIDEGHKGYLLDKNRHIKESSWQNMLNGRKVKSYSIRKVGTVRKIYIYDALIGTKEQIMAHFRISERFMARNIQRGIAKHFYTFVEGNEEIPSVNELSLYLDQLIEEEEKRRRYYEKLELEVEKKEAEERERKKKLYTMSEWSKYLFKTMFRKW